MGVFQIRVKVEKNPELGFSISGGVGGRGNPFRPDDNVNSYSCFFSFFCFTRHSNRIPCFIWMLVIFIFISFLSGYICDKGSA